MRYIVKGIRRYRYISFQVVNIGGNHTITEMELIQALRQHTHALFSKTAKELGLWIIHFNENAGIIRCNYKEKDHTIQLLTSLKKIELKSISITTMRTSGTIRGITR